MDGSTRDGVDNPYERRSRDLENELVILRPMLLAQWGCIYTAGAPLCTLMRFTAAGVIRGDGEREIKGCFTPAHAAHRLERDPAVHNPTFLRPLFAVRVASCRVIIESVSMVARSKRSLSDPLHGSVKHPRRSPRHPGGRTPTGHARRLGAEETEEEDAGCGGISTIHSFAHPTRPL